MAGGGDAEDFQNDNNGTPQNGVGFANGKIEQAFNFNGDDDFVSFGNSVGNFGTADFTIDFWIKTSSTRIEGILGKQQGDRIINFGDPRKAGQFVI